MPSHSRIAVILFVSGVILLLFTLVLMIIYSDPLRYFPLIGMAGGALVLIAWLINRKKSDTKIESILSTISLLLLFIAVIGGFFTLGQDSFGYFAVIGLAGLVIQIEIAYRKKQM